MSPTEPNQSTQGNVSSRARRSTDASSEAFAPYRIGWVTVGPYRACTVRSPYVLTKELVFLFQTKTGGLGGTPRWFPVPGAPGHRSLVPGGQARLFMAGKTTTGHGWTRPTVFHQ